MAFRNLVLAMGLCSCVFGGSSFGATNREWRPFKLDVIRSGQVEAPPRGARAHPQSVELSIWGGYTSGFGLLKAGSLAADLMTGRWSPWFGEGYTVFGWGGTIDKLDGSVGGPMLRKVGGSQFGMSLGFFVSTSLQAEFFFQYSGGGYQIDDNIWAQFSAVREGSINRVRALGRSVEYPTDSYKETGRTYFGGINLNLLISTFGPIAPYVSFGAGIMAVTALPSVAWSMTQAQGGTQATYNIAMEYGSGISPIVSAGLGFKFYLDKNYLQFMAPNFGLKVEARGIMSYVSLAKSMGCGFSATSAAWIPYDGYSGTAVKETGFPIMLGIQGGLFYSF